MVAIFLLEEGTVRTVASLCLHTSLAPVLWETLRVGWHGLKGHISWMWERTHVRISKKVSMSVSSCCMSWE